MSIVGSPMRFWRDFLSNDPRSVVEEREERELSPPPKEGPKKFTTMKAAVSLPSLDAHPLPSSPRNEHSHPPLEEMGKLPGYHNVTFNSVILKPPPPEKATQERPEREIFKRSTNITELQARDALLEHITQGKKKSFWRRKSPDEHITINDSIASKAIRYTLESFLESRSIVWSCEPHYGGDIVNTGVPPAPWDIKAEPPNVFQPHTVALEVPDTSLVKPCHICQSMGSDRCNFCFGTGKITCIICGGTGIRSAFKEGENRRVACGCMGGQQWCDHCKGTGRNRCKECQGRRYLRWFIMLSVQWSLHEDEHIEPGSALGGEHIKGAVSDIIYEEVYPRVWPITTFPFREICDRSKQFVPLHETMFHMEKIVMQRQRIHSIPVIQVFYSHEGQYFSFFAYGLDHKIHAPDLPKQKLCSGCSVL